MVPGAGIELLILLATATAVTAKVEGGSGVRRLYVGVTRWRFPGRWYGVAVGLAPAATVEVAVAAAAGTLHAPSNDWATEAVQYLFLTIVFGALLGKHVEELA